MDEYEYRIPVHQPPSVSALFFILNSVKKKKTNVIILFVSFRELFEF